MKTPSIAALTLFLAACSTPAESAAPPAVTESDVSAQPSPEPAAEAPVAREHVAASYAAPQPDMWSDANGNGIDDVIDIIRGTSLDENINGIPDEAESPD